MVFADGGSGYVPVLFQVILYCDPNNGAVNTIQSVSGQVTFPDGGVVITSTPTWTIVSTRLDCTFDQFKSEADIALQFAPPSPGDYVAQVTVEKNDGTFKRTVTIKP